MSETFVEVSLPPHIKALVETLANELVELEKELDLCDANGTDTKDVRERIRPKLVEYDDLILHHGVTRTTWFERLASLFGL